MVDHILTDDEEAFIRTHGWAFRLQVIAAAKDLLRVATENRIGSEVFVSAVSTSFAQVGLMSSSALMSGDEYADLLADLVRNSTSVDRAEGSLQ